MATHHDLMLDIYESAVRGLDTFELGRSIRTRLRQGATHLELVRRAGNHLSLIDLHTDRTDAGDRAIAVMMRALADFADLLGWTITSDTRRLGFLSEDPAAFLARFGFVAVATGTTMRRLPHVIARQEPGHTADFNIT